MAFREISEDSEGAWPAFADLLAGTTLLFLVLFAVIAVPALEQNARSNRLRSTLREIESVLRADNFNVQGLGDHVLVTIPGDATFGYDKFYLPDMKPEGRTTLRRIAAALSKPSVKDSVDQIQVVGHTSSEGGDEHNWRLSSQRAASVALFLIDSTGLDTCKVTALGRGRYYPVDPDGARRSSRPNPADRRIELEIWPIIVGSRGQTDRRHGCVATPGRG